MENNKRFSIVHNRSLGAPLGIALSKRRLDLVTSVITLYSTCSQGPPAAFTVTGRSDPAWQSLGLWTQVTGAQSPLPSVDFARAVKTRAERSIGFLTENIMEFPQRAGIGAWRELGRVRWPQGPSRSDLWISPRGSNTSARSVLRGFHICCSPPQNVLPRCPPPFQPRLGVSAKTSLPPGSLP